MRPFANAAASPARPPRRRLDAGRAFPQTAVAQEITDRMNTPADILLVTATKVKSLAVGDDRLCFHAPAAKATDSL